MSEHLLRVELVPLSQAVGWEWQANPKKHDIDRLKAALRAYGFQDPPKFDPSIPSREGNGGLVGGNGRTLALWEMCQAGEEPPAGIPFDAETNEWHIPVVFGNDLSSQAVAEAFALDANNLTLAGGNLDAIEMSLVYDRKQYQAVLEALHQAETLPVTVDGEAIAVLLDNLDDSPTDPDDEWGYGLEELDEANKEIVEEEIEPADTTAIIGSYFAFPVKRDVYLEWVEALRQEVGFARPVIEAEIVRRLGLYGQTETI